MKKIDICKGLWKLIYVKNEILKKDGMTSDVNVLRGRGYPEIPATVPGNLEIDLENAGVIDDPLYADNYRKRDCEYLHMFYHRSFVYDGSLENPAIIFEGLDTVSEVYLNGQLIGTPENMLIPHTVEPGTALVLGENKLCVHIIPAVIAARRYKHTLNDSAMTYNFESLYIRKAPHMYGWDIMPRIISGGIWRPVYLTERKSNRITELYGYTVSIDRENSKAWLHFYYNTEIDSDEIERYSIRITGKCGDSVFTVTRPLYHTGNSFEFSINNAKLWWPRNSGEPNVYKICAFLVKDGNEVDTYETKLGIRMVKLERTPLTNENGEGEFRFVINGKPIFCMGTNWVPVDALHSRDESRLPDILPMLNDTGCNIIRIWGGNIYESDLLYDFCDENGIMIWQDFIMGCATYPKDPEFAGRLFDEVCVAVKRLRHHPSIIIWAGDNECDERLAKSTPNGNTRDPAENYLTRNVIPLALEMHDFSRPYLPSSPCMDGEYFSLFVSGKKPQPSENHTWGPRDYFKGDYYKNTVCHFASEVGYHGCPSPDSIKKFIPKDSLWTARNSENWEGIENHMWIARSTSMEDSGPFAYRTRLMADQVTTLFGGTVPCTLNDFAKASQISQAEAKKYFIERFRISKWRRTGIIWWNLIDGCPQFSDAVVDYYFVKKLAYHYIKRSQKPVCLMCDEPENGVLPLYAVNDLPQEKKFTYKITDITSDHDVCSGSATAKQDASSLVCNIPVVPGEKHFYFIEWDMDGEHFTNHFMTDIRDIDYSEYIRCIEKCGYAEYEGFGGR